MTPDSRILACVVMVGTLAASACAIPLGGGAPSAQQPAPTAALDACRYRADQIFARQNPDNVYRVDDYHNDTRDAPFATTGTKGVTSAGLPEQFGRDNNLDACLRASGYGAPAPQSPNIHENLPVGH
jgi:hypothetical protein